MHPTRAVRKVQCSRWEDAVFAGIRLKSATAHAEDTALLSYPKPPSFSPSSLHSTLITLKGLAKRGVFSKNGSFSSGAACLLRLSCSRIRSKSLLLFQLSDRDTEKRLNTRTPVYTPCRNWGFPTRAHVQQQSNVEMLGMLTVDRLVLSSVCCAPEQ